MRAFRSIHRRREYNERPRRRPPIAKTIDTQVPFSLVAKYDGNEIFIVTFRATNTMSVPTIQSFILPDPICPRLLRNSTHP